MKIAVYDCVAGDALTDKYGPVAQTVTTWIKPHMPDADFFGLNIAQGLPMPKPGEVDGIIITGSEKGVYDDTPWMKPLRENLEAMRAHGTPIFGICFGHQIMADTFGGKAEKLDQGFITGTRQFEMDGKQTSAFIAHQDQVTEIPPNATVIASAAYCPAAALSYDFPALSVQFHPEYDAGFTNDLIDMFGDDLMTKAEIKAAKESTKANVSSDLYGPQVADFFRTHIA